MERYLHRVQYYETDKMGITHHSNYIRFMEEARMHFLTALGYPMTRLEAEGITSPVVSVQCDYKKTTTYDDVLAIGVVVEAYSGVKLTLSYEMTRADTGELVATATSSHCFLNAQGRPIALRKHAPALDALLRTLG